MNHDESRHYIYIYILVSHTRGKGYDCAWKRLGAVAISALKCHYNHPTRLQGLAIDLPDIFPSGSWGISHPPYAMAVPMFWILCSF